MNTRRPLVSLGICFIAGTWLALSRDVPFVYVFAVTWLLLLASLISKRLHRSRVATLILLFATVAVGWSAARLRLEVTSNSVAKLQTNSSTNSVELIGTASDDPSAGPSATYRVPWRFTVRVNRARVRPDDPWRSAGGTAKVQLWCHTKARAPAYGEEYLIRGKAVLSAGYAANPNLPKYWHITGSLRKAKLLAKNKGNPFISWCYEQRRAAASYLTIGIQDFRDYTGLLSALVLGYRRSLPPRLKADFRSTGAIHIFAISGLHVGMVALLITFVLGAFRISRVYWILFLAPLIVTYTVATGARASAVRACLMLITYFAAPLLHRKPDVFSALSLSAVLILAASPTQLLDRGFIFSFAVVTGIIVLYPHFERPMRRLWESDPLRVQAESKRMMLFKVLVKRICSLVAISCSAWLVSAPLTAFFFGRFSPIALVSNIVVVPLAFLIVLTGSLSLLLGSCLLLFANIFNHANVALVALLVRVVRLMARTPFGSVETGTVPLWGVVVWCVGLAVVVRCLSRSRASLHLNPRGGP